MVIVDASIVFKWFDANEQLHAVAQALLKRHLSGEEEILVPNLLLYEVTNAWVTKTRLGQEEISDNLTRLEKYKLNIAPVDFKLLHSISRFSKNYGISAYDATYAILAQEREYDLITADDKFANKVKLSFVKNLSEFTGLGEVGRSN